MRRHSPPNESSDERAAAVFRDAGTLLERCGGNWIDRRERRDGWQIHYAVDVDVIVSYMSPASNSAQWTLFSHDTQLAEILVRLNSEFVMQALNGSPYRDTPRGSLLVISPHDEELHRILIALRRRYAKNTDRSSSQWEYITKLINDGATDDEIATELIKRAADVLHEVGGGQGPLEEVQRLAALDPWRLINVGSYQEGGDEGASFRFPRPPRDAAHVDFAAFSGRYGQWKAALATHVPKDKSQTAVNNDARALTTMEWINSQIRHQKRRIVLITGSRSIFDATADIGLNPGTDDGLGFEYYLRHPQAFLSDDRFFASSAGAEVSSATDFKLFDWLNLFFPTVIGKQTQGAFVRRAMFSQAIDMPPAKWRELARELKTDAASHLIRTGSKGFLDSLIGRWQEQVRTVAVERGVASAVEEPLSKAGKVVSLLRNQGDRDGIERFRKHLAQRATQSLAKLYESTAFLGEFALRDDDSKIRGIPALRFDEEFASVQRICDQMQHSMFRGSVVLDLEALYKDLSNVDQHRYYPLLVHALAYAIRGHWFGTQTLCQVALEIARDLDEAGLEKRTGREAAYLLAVAKRRLADTQEDLAKARESLKQARAIEPASALDPRFESEELAADIFKFYLRRFGDAPAVEQQQERMALLEEGILRGRRLLTKLPDEPLKKVVAWITRQVFLNVVGLALITELDYPRSVDGHLGHLREMTEMFRAARLAPDVDEGYRDMLSDVVYWAVVATFNPDEEQRRRAAIELSKVTPMFFGRDRARVEALCKVGLDRAYK